MSEFLHIIDRATIHFTSATSLVLSIAIGIRFASKKTKWLPRSLPQVLLLSAMTVFAISTLREAYDVAHGQSLVKAFTDYASWLAGTGCAAWGLYRWSYFGWDSK